MDTLEILEDNKVIGVIRGFEPENAKKIAEKMVKGGVKTIEITMDSPKAPEAIEEIDNDFDKAFVGAGTVLEVDDVREAKKAGAEFAFSPVFDRDVVDSCKEEDLAVVPGCMTPNEIMEACQYGVDAVKVFPASIMGPEFVKKVKGPLSHVPLIPTGGITASNAPEFMDAGAVAVGVGSYLCGQEVIKESGLSKVTERAKALLEEVESL